MKLIPKRFSKEHINERVNWINNQLVNSYMLFDLPATIEKTLNWYTKNLSNRSRIDFSFIDESNTIFGMGGFTGISEVNRNAEFYVMVNPAFLGKGIGKIISRWMFNYGFSVLKLNKIYLYTDDANISACRIYESSGFVLEGVLREHNLKDNRFIDRRIYGLLKKEWEWQDWHESINNEI